MLTLNGNNFFFFSENVSSIKIKSNTLEHAYLLILNEDLDSAKFLFKTIDSPRGLWGEVLVSVLQGFIDKYPTYFQIRNFYEIDLDFLLKNEKIHYVEQLLGALDVFSSINQEVYKYAARVMYENKLYSAALRYMNKSKKIYYNDAELHFMLSKYYYRVNDTENAEFYVKECLKIIPDYYPAKLLLNKIEANLF